MKSRRLLNLSSLLVGIAFALAASASPFSISSRVTLGPSLNKDMPSTAPPSPAASPIPTPAAPASASASTTVPLAQPTARPAPATTTQSTIVVVQPERPPNAMERAGQLVRSVLRKIDPKAPVVAPHDAVELNRSRSITGMSVNTTTSISVPPNASLTAASDTSANGAVPITASERRAKSMPLNPSMNKQEKNVANADPSKEARQLQRGIMNEQKMNVGMNQ